MEEENSGKYLKNIKKGMEVEILTKSKKIVRGIVRDLGLRKDFDSQGIMVVLETGEIGRVKKIFSNKPISEIESLIKKGESNKLEFKSSALWSLNKTEQEIKESKSYELHTYRQKASKVIIAKSIAALLNSEGGNLMIGIKEKKNNEGSFEIIGIEDDLKKLSSFGKDSGKDGYKRMIIDEIIRPYFPYEVYNRLNHFLKIDFEEVNEKTLCNIFIKKSPIRIFLNLENKKVFMIRTETESRQITDEELVDYCMKRFSRNF